MSKRIKDANGYWLVKDNPISKIGVFPYLGSELPSHLGLEPGKVYSVYRPESTLSDPATIESFAGIPFIDDHEWLGKGGTPAEKKGVQGVTLGNARYDAPYLRADLKVFSDAAQGLIEGGKVELSPGYKCDYLLETGEFDGHRYDVVQYNMRGNHLALVEKGRTGPDVAVQDHLTITLDSGEFVPMEFTEEQIAKINKLIADGIAAALKKSTDEEVAKAAEEKKPEDEAGAVSETPEAAIAEVQASVEEASTSVEQINAVAAEISAALEVVQEAAEVVQEAATATDRAAAIKKHKAAMDGFSKALAKAKGRTSKASDSGSVASLKGEIAELRRLISSQTVDAAGIAGQIAMRDSLAKGISDHVGTFDHAAMGLADVAKYGIKKLNITGIPEGSEVVAMNAWLSGRSIEKPVKTEDSQKRTGLASQWEKQGN